MVVLQHIYSKQQTTDKCLGLIYKQRRYVAVMKLDISKVEFSNADLRRKIRIPEILTLEICEIMGILAGDGNSYKYIKGKKIRV